MYKLDSVAAKDSQARSTVLYFQSQLADVQSGVIHYHKRLLQYMDYFTTDKADGFCAFVYDILEEAQK